MDYLDTASWLPQAEKLKPGERRRVDHDCGGGRTLLIQRTDKGLDAFCWRCNASGFRAAPEEPWQDRIARLAKQAEAERELARTVTLPTPMNTDPRTWPLYARVWLYKAGLTNDEIVRHQFYYHARTDRVVLPVLWREPVHDSDVLLFWQARGFSPDRPKYINPEVPREGLLYTCPPRAEALAGQVRPELVLTEDILSAVRVSAVAEAWSLMGTSMSAAAFNAVMADKRPVAIWLDPDKAGARGAAKVAKLLTAYGRECRIITSTRDPKLHSLEEIACHLRLQSSDC